MIIKAFASIIEALKMIIKVTTGIIHVWKMIIRTSTGTAFFWKMIIEIQIAIIHVEKTLFCILVNNKQK